MKTPHKHAALIKAWADGATIQRYYAASRAWADCGDNQPNWHVDALYRIKPEPEPDIVKHGYACLIAENVSLAMITNIECGRDNIKMVFDGETKKLKSIEMIK